MQALKYLRREWVIPGALITGALVIVLICVRFVFVRFSSLHQSLDYLQKQIAQAEVLIDHTSRLEPKKLDRELEELNARLESPLLISAVLEELGRIGEENGVYFKSVEPSGTETEGSVAMKVVLDGQYQGIGKFLGILDQLDTALIRVKNYNLKSQDVTAPLAMNLEIELYRPPMEGE